MILKALICIIDCLIRFAEEEIAEKLIIKAK